MSAMFTVRFRSPIDDTDMAKSGLTRRGTVDLLGRLHPDASVDVTYGPDHAWVGSAHRVIGSLEDAYTARLVGDMPQPLGPTVVLGDLSVALPDEDAETLIRSSEVTPHNLDDVPERPIWRINTGDGMGCFLVVDHPSDLYTTLERAYLDAAMPVSGGEHNEPVADDRDSTTMAFVEAARRIGHRDVPMPPVRFDDDEDDWYGEDSQRRHGLSEAVSVLDDTLDDLRGDPDEADTIAIAYWEGGDEAWTYAKSMIENALPTATIGKLTEPTDLPRVEYREFGVAMWRDHRWILAYRPRLHMNGDDYRLYDLFTSNETVWVDADEIHQRYDVLSQEQSVWVGRQRLDPVPGEGPALVWQGDEFGLQYAQNEWTLVHLASGDTRTTTDLIGIATIAQRMREAYERTVDRKKQDDRYALIGGQAAMALDVSYDDLLDDDEWDTFTRENVVDPRGNNDWLYDTNEFDGDPDDVLFGSIEPMPGDDYEWPIPVTEGDDMHVGRTVSGGDHDDLPDRYGDAAVLYSSDDDYLAETYGEDVWIVADAQIILGSFDDKADALAFQRLYRKGNGLDPDTGTWPPMSGGDHDEIPDRCPMCGEDFDPVEFSYGLGRHELVEVDGVFAYDGDGFSILDDYTRNTIGCRHCGEDFDDDLQRLIGGQIGTHLDIDDPVGRAAAIAMVDAIRTIATWVNDEVSSIGVALDGDALTLLDAIARELHTEAWGHALERGTDEPSAPPVVSGGEHIDLDDVLWGEDGEGAYISFGPKGRIVWDGEDDEGFANARLELDDGRDEPVEDDRYAHLSIPTVSGGDHDDDEDDELATFYVTVREATTYEVQAVDHEDAEEQVWAIRNYEPAPREIVGVDVERAGPAPKVSGGDHDLPWVTMTASTGEGEIKGEMPVDELAFLLRALSPDDYEVEVDGVAYGGYIGSASDVLAEVLLDVSPISDARARTLACEWHSGGDSPLYVLCSTGHVQPGVEAEIQRCIDWLSGKSDVPLPPHDEGYTHDDMLDDLRSLETYAALNRERPSVLGWSDLWEDSPAISGGDHDDESIGQGEHPFPSIKPYAVLSWIVDDGNDSIFVFTQEDFWTLAEAKSRQLQINALFMLLDWEHAFATTVPTMDDDGYMIPYESLWDLDKWGIGDES